MEQETKEQPSSPETRHDAAVITPSQGEVIEAPPTQEMPCPTCSGGAVAVSYVYAIGRVEARFPNLAAEKEFAQATGRTETAGKTDQQTFHAVLSKRENRYLVRQLCWVLTIQGLETTPFKSLSQ